MAEWTPEITTALLSLVGTLAGTFGGIMTSNRLTGYRIEQLEKKVEKHNNLIDRTYKLEEQNAVQDDQIKMMLKQLETISHE